jgi:uncharacterized protein YbjT (DUF2867 family)
VGRALFGDHEGVILLTGATGYVGGRLLNAFERRGVPVRALARRPTTPTAPTTEWVVGDVRDDASLQRAMSGVHTAYYLVHSMGGPGDFAERDREAARCFAAAARTAGIGRIIYLGGLGASDRLSEHLASRQEVGRILRESGVPVVEFRASIIVGSGSLSFEIVRSLVDKLPVMVTPRWVTTLAQPIAIGDVVEYLQEAAAADLPEGGVFEIGGPDRVSYGGIMREYARQKGVRRLLIRVPVLSPRLSGLWLGLMAPRYAKVGRALIEGVRNETVVQDAAARSRFTVRPRGIADAVRSALDEQPPETPALRGATAAAVLGAALALCLGAGGVGCALQTSPPCPLRLLPCALSAVAAWLVWKRDGLRETRLASVVFLLMMALQALSPAAGRVVAGLLALTILVTGGLFFVRRRVAGMLLLPSLIWIAGLRGSL